MSSALNIPHDRVSRDAYIRKGPVRDFLDSYPKSGLGKKHQRSFQSKWFEGRKWLEYSKDYDAAFCFPCRVFGTAIYDETFQKTGFRQWHRALETNRGFAKHAMSQQHEINMNSWQTFLSSEPIDAQLNAERRRILELGNKERQNRYEVLPILLDVTNTLAKLHLPFRGHDETETSSNKGVFLEVVELVSRWNADLANHLKQASAKPKSYPSYTSPSSQNEMIQYSAQYVREKIVKDVKASKYFAVCLDTTPDTSKRDQLSIIVRYVGANGDISEDLLDFVHAEEMTAEGLFESLKSVLDKYELKMDNIRGQGYDGCSTMSGCYSGLQARVREVCESAYFVHCYAHRLNLVIVDTCSKNTVIRNFFGVVQSLYAFIEGSTKRHAVFKEIQEQLISESENDEESKSDSAAGGGSKTLHSLSTTRWSTRFDNCKALEDNLLGVVKTLDTIIQDSSYDRKTAGEATSLMKAIDFEFCLTLTIMTDLLKLTNIVSKNLQSKTLNIAAASVQVEALISEISKKRSDEQFGQYWDRTVRMADSIGVEFIENRRRKVSRRVDENAQNEMILDDKSNYKVHLHFEAVDLLLTALRSRFHPDVMPLLNSTDCLVNPSAVKMDKVEKLRSFYLNDLDEQLELEYRLFCNALSLTWNKEKSLDNMHEIYVHMVDNGMVDLYPNVGRAYKLALTLPASSCSCERSFSALKFVKNALRSTMQ